MAEQLTPTERTAILRILDANANRALEGLRVVEEYVRFVAEDRHLASACKQFRHQLAEALQNIPASDRCAVRDTRGDVGTQVEAADEYHRWSAQDVSLANQKRVEQALRCLEEYAKPLFPGVAAWIEQHRYEAYTLFRSIQVTVDSRARLRDAKLYVLLDGGRSLEEFVSLSQALIQAGAHVLQLREKRLGDRELLQRAHRLRQLTRESSTQLIVNDRPDIAILADADGVHVGQEELAVKEVRQIVGPRKMIGVSTHSVEQARRAVEEGANYIGCGPTFPSTTKGFMAFPGCDFLREVAGEIGLPAFAIGGIRLDNVEQVLTTGIRRVAVGAAITCAPRPAEAVQQFLARLG